MSEELAEVVAEEDAELARNLPAVREHEAMVTRAEITPEEVAAQRDKVVQVMRDVMTAEQHYGRIPGVQKPTLLKPGAELLAVTFRLAPHYQSERIFHDDGHLTVVSKVTLTHIPSGLTIAEGEGLCTSREKKYAYRGSGRNCPNCGAAGTIQRSKFPPRASDYEGASPTDDPGWYCYAKKGGCGMNFAAVDPAITGQEDKPQPNPDLADTFNTVLKMANKRALVAAILNGTAASDIFTQDVEDTGDQNQFEPPKPKQERRENVKVSVPRTWQDIEDRTCALLGSEEGIEWLKQAAAFKGKLPAPPLIQRLGGVVVDLTEAGFDFEFTPGVRKIVADIFAARLDGNMLDGPAWALEAIEAEQGRPSKEQVLAEDPETASDPVNEDEIDAAWEASGKEKP